MALRGRPAAAARSWQRQRRRLPPPRCSAEKQQQQQPQPQQTQQQPLEVSRSLAAARAAEAARPEPLVCDPFAAALAGPGGSAAPDAALLDVVATRYIDESLLNAMAATNVNTIASGDYRQVVLLGDGLDCRPFRLPWPPGTLLFLVAPAEVHAAAEALLAAAPAPAHVPRGCLLRRVPLDLGAAACAGDGGGSVFAAALARGGFRADRLSVWALQGLHGLGLGAGALRALLAEVADGAAFHSLLVGELPGPLRRGDAANLLAEAGLLGAVYAHADEAYGRLGGPAGGRSSSGSSSGGGDGDSGGAAAAAGGGDDAVAERWLVTAQQLRLSLAQMGIYDDWSAEFEAAEAGDDATTSSLLRPTRIEASARRGPRRRMSAMAGRAFSLRYLAARLGTAAELVAKEAAEAPSSGAGGLLDRFREALSKQLTTVIAVTGAAMAPAINAASASDPGAYEKLVVRVIPRPSARTVNVGDVVAFSSPLSPPSASSLLVRRVAALQGHPMLTADDEEHVERVPPGHCWVLADNERLSPPDVIDSRAFGYLDMRLITGRVLYRVGPGGAHGRVANSPASEADDDAVIESEVDAGALAEGMPGVADEPGGGGGGGGGGGAGEEAGGSTGKQER
ncbi:MTS1 [Scenedesmus sp. PABB004]|nr:MTS1 [Scenedesmus sp. PABB004]